MSADLRIQHCGADHAKTDGFDLLLVALGYEQRSRAFAELYRGRVGRRVALAFDDNRVLDYDVNHRLLSDMGFECFPASDKEFSRTLKEIIADTKCANASKFLVCIDISSFTRSRLAAILQCLVARAAHQEVVATWYYSLASHSISDRDDQPFCAIGPVSPMFAGWSFRPAVPTSAIVGLGYEAGRAIGALEQLQADKTWLYQPSSPIGEYKQDLEFANKVLINSVPGDRWSEYSVLDPVRLFQILESQVYGLLRSSRPAILPFGPKIFALVAMLVSLVHPELSVWRASSGEPENPVNRLASGFACALRTRIRVTQ